MGVCDVPVGNLGFGCSPDLGFPVSVAITTQDPDKTKEEIRLQATWDELLKLDENRVQLIPADLFEYTADEKITETLSGGRDIDRFDDAGEMIVRTDKMPASVVRNMSQQYDGKKIFYCILYSRNFVVGRTDANELDFIWRKGTMSFSDEMSTEEAAGKGRTKFVSSDSEGDRNNKAVYKLDFAANFDVAALTDGKFSVVAGSTTSVLKVKLNSKPIYDNDATQGALSIPASDLTTLVSDLIVTNAAGDVQSITSVTAGANQGEIDINFTIALSADTYTVTMVTPANTTSTSIADYDFSTTSVEIAVS